MFIAVATKLSAVATFPATVGRLRNVVIVVSTFWAFAGVTSVHGIWARMIHTFAVTDLLLLALLAAVAIVPLSLFASSRATLQSPAAGRPAC